MEKEFENEVDKRSPQIVLQPKQIALFYKILCYCESNAINTTYFRLDQNPIKKELQTKRRKDSVLIKSNKKGQSINFNLPYKKNEFRYKLTKNKGEGKSLLIHIRNAFAHNRISVVKNKNKSCVLEFIDMTRNQITMMGNIEFSLLNRIIVAVFKKIKL